LFLTVKLRSADTSAGASVASTVSESEVESMFFFCGERRRGR
jgi:hypothetical protein